MMPGEIVSPGEVRMPGGLKKTWIASLAETAWSGVAATDVQVSGQYFPEFYCSVPILYQIRNICWNPQSLGPLHCPIKVT